MQNDWTIEFKLKSIQESVNKAFTYLNNASIDCAEIGREDLQNEANRLKEEVDKFAEEVRLALEKHRTDWNQQSK